MKYLLGVLEYNKGLDSERINIEFDKFLFDRYKSILEKYKSNIIEYKEFGDVYHSNNLISFNDNDLKVFRKYNIEYVCSNIDDSMVKEYLEINLIFYSRKFELSIIKDDDEYYYIMIKYNGNIPNELRDYISIITLDSFHIPFFKFDQIHGLKKMLKFISR